ncbi:MAG: SIS domain-containing protein [Candidatus Brocadiaceae bacterium]|nr:SIS domain-containing protein [Candidatus Brocadiaceae bacterium]
MAKFENTYFDSLISLIHLISVYDDVGNGLDLTESIKNIGNLILTQADFGKKLLFIGNGASAAISSHMATDFCKNRNVRAMALNDSSLLTCMSNDYGYNHVFEKPIEIFADEGDILFAISSSGKSENILRGARAAKLKGCTIVTLSGFNNDNPLTTEGIFNFHVPSNSYGPVEIIHHSICHCILDTIKRDKNCPIMSLTATN